MQQIKEDKEMTISRILKGAVYSLCILMAMVVNLSTANADVVGIVTSISDKVIEIDGTQYELPLTVLPMEKTAGDNQVEVPTNLKLGQAVLFKEDSGTINSITVLNEEIDTGRSGVIKESHSAK